MNEWLLLQEGFIIYVALLVLLLGGAIGLPIPEDIPLVLAGVAVQTGRADLLLVFLVAYFGIVAGDVLIFFIGRKLGPALFQKKWLRARFKPSRVKLVRMRLEKRSIIMIFVARHLFYLRTLTFLACGVFKMRFLRFFLADALAALISAPLMIGLGYLAARNYDGLLLWIGEAKTASLIFIALVPLVAYRYLRGARKPGKVAAAVPETEGEDLSVLDTLNFGGEAQLVKSRDGNTAVERETPNNW